MIAAWQNTDEVVVGEHKRLLRLYKNYFLTRLLFYQGNTCNSVYGRASFVQGDHRNHYKLVLHHIKNWSSNYFCISLQEIAAIEITASASGCEDSYHAVQDALNSLGTGYTHDHLIAKLTFGFWRYQFGKKEFAASGSVLLNIFPGRPFGTSRNTCLKIKLTKLLSDTNLTNAILYFL